MAKKIGVLLALEVIKFNEDPIVTRIHIGEKCGQGYLMKIDYAERTVDISRNEDAGK